MLSFNRGTLVKHRQTGTLGTITSPPDSYGWAFVMFDGSRGTTFVHVNDLRIERVI